MRAPIRIAAIAAAIAGCCWQASAEPLPAGYVLVPGSFAANRGPDGNSVFIDAPDGLILVDSGRHPAHRDTLLRQARDRGRPIAAIVNTHWHLDHSTGNAEILAAHPGAEVVASRSVDGALFKSFIAKSRVGAEAYLASGKASPEQVAEIRRSFTVMDNLEPLRPTRPVSGSGPMALAGRTLLVNLAPFAATEGDVWLYDPDAKLAIVGDLVVAPVPFMDTACVEGWLAALAQIEATPWQMLIPGHGEPMGRAEFSTWLAAFRSLVECSRSPAPTDACADGWVRDARPFIAEGDADRINAMATYYLQTRLRALPDEQQRYCAGAQGP